MTREWELGPALLFCPADRPDRVLRAAAIADAVVIDLEDGVHPHHRVLARTNLLAIANDLDPDTTIVRVNASGTSDLALDLDAISRTSLGTLMLPKAESPEQLENLIGWSIVGLCETPQGVISAPAIASAENCVGLMWGSEDLAASLGGGSSRSTAGALSQMMSKARCDVLLAARASGVLAIDTVFVDIEDQAGLAAETEEAAHMGFNAKACIHPSQLDLVRDGFRPTSAEVSWALKMLSAAEESDAGALLVDGQMIDEAVLRRARIVASRAMGSSV